MCILKVSCSVFLNWVCWARGNFLASRVTYISGYVSLRCVECRAGTSIFVHFAGVGGGAVRIFCFLWLRFGVFGVIEVGGGWRDSTGFLISLALFGRYGTIELAGLCCNFFFIFSSFMSLLLASGYAR